MSFSGKVKEEAGLQFGRGRHCEIAEFAAVFYICGKVRQDRSGNLFLFLSTENLTVAKKSYILLEKVFQIHAEVVVRNHNVHTSRISFVLFVRRKEDVFYVLKAIKRMDEDGQEILWGVPAHVHQRLIQNTCCKRAFLRGTFLAAGSVTDPEKGYHLEIPLWSKEYAEAIRKIMADFGLGAKIVIRKKYHVLYMKEGSQIVDFLNVIEAHVALMELENVRILKEVRNSVNRQVNCETANIEKTVTAAARQIEDIRYLECNMGFSQLADGLREIAELRLEYPDCSLQELGQMLPDPISKSGVNHRLRKISKLADEIRNKN